jgi:hypothetical protein
MKTIIRNTALILAIYAFFFNEYSADYETVFREARKQSEVLWAK